MKILVLNGPNLNMLGIRETSIYGNQTYQDLINLIKDYTKLKKINVIFKQSNSEGVLIDIIHKYYKQVDGIIFNPGAYTHTSIALLDALKAVNILTVEVHLSDIDNREDFRKVNYIKAACFASVTNMGFKGYIKAIDLLEEKINDNRSM